MTRPEPRRRGPYAKSAQSRAAILEAAFAVFAEHGYADSSTKQVAARAGLSEAGMLHHFPTKAALLLAVLEYREELSETRFALRGQPPRRQLETLIELAAYNVTVPAIIQLYATTAVAATAPGHPAHAHFAERYRTVVGYLEGSLHALRESGELRAGVEPRSAAAAGIALWDGLQTQWLFDPARIDIPARLRDYLDALLVEPLARDRRPPDPKDSRS